MKLKFNNSNALYGTFNTLIKCCGILLIMGFIFTLISGTLGYMIYSKDAILLEFDGFNEIIKLNLTYALIGILISIVLNIVSYLIYNKFVSGLKIVMTSIASLIFLAYSFVLNILIKFMYEGFATYIFDIKYLDIFKIIFVNFGFITYPLIFLIVYMIKNHNKNNKIIAK